MIHFVNNTEDILDHPSSRVVLIDDSLRSERDVIDRIEKALESPYDQK